MRMMRNQPPPIVSDAIERYCPCCGWSLGRMADSGWHDWLGRQIERLRQGDRPELAEALARFVAAQYGEGVEP